MATTIEELRAQHSRELKELQGGVTRLRKQAQADKKRKKELLEEVAVLEQTTKTRHQDELAALQATETAEESSLLNGVDEQKGKRKNRQTAKKERQAAELEEVKRQAEEEIHNTPDKQQIEMEVLQASLLLRQLEIHQIKADGHCMYNAIADQLQHTSLQEGVHDDAAIELALPADCSALRRAAAQYMRTHTDDFFPFMIDEKSNDIMTDDAWQRYCNDLELTAVWGGQHELRALSHVLKREIEVHQSGCPVVKMGEEYTRTDQSPLLLSYHRYQFGLGEHYNSLRPRRTT